MNVFDIACAFAVAICLGALWYQNDAYDREHDTKPEDRHRW